MKRSAAARGGARKPVFRATVGLSINQQLAIASQLKTQGDDVFKTIQKLKKTSKNQKQATKDSSLKFEWLKDNAHLKKLEESCSKELESMLLRMYNDASTLRESKKQSAYCSTENETNQDGDSFDPNTEGFQSTSASYAEEVEELIRLEQVNRVALIKQITSEREQREALKQFLSAVSQKESPEGSLEDNNQIQADDMLENMRLLLYDAVIGREMIEASLEEEVEKSDKEFKDCYKIVVAGMKEDCHQSPHNSSNNESRGQQIESMIDAAGGQECPDEMLVIEITEEFQKVFEELDSDLSAYEQSFLAAASAADAAGSIEAAIAKFAGWTESDEERFSKVLRSFETKHGSRKKSLLYDQLALVLPGVELAQIKQHVTFHQHLRFYQQKCKDRQRELQRKLQELQVEAKAKIHQAIEREKDRERKLQQLSEMQQQCNERHGQVAQWRVTKEAKERIETQQREIERMMKDQKDQEEENRWKKKHEQQKMAVDEYKKSKAIEKMVIEALATEEEQRREAERVIQSVVNAERVQYRQEEFQRKLEGGKVEQLHKVQLEQQRLAKLNELKEKTPYAQIIANITADPERTRQETAAFRANVEAAQQGLAISETGLFPSHGYDCETLFKNARFKLGIALRNAGLNSSEYARQALANVKVCNVGAYRNHVAEPTQLW